MLEFRPGEPWKGYPNIDPETDPYITPGSVTNNLSINTVREADHLRDRNSGMYLGAEAGHLRILRKKSPFSGPKVVPVSIFLSFLLTCLL